MVFCKGQADKKLRYALAVGVLALGVAVTAAPVKAATVTDIISFTDTGTYPTNGDPTYPYNPAGVASASFSITFDPTQTYVDQSIAGVISGLTYSVTDPYFNPSTLTFNPILDFSYSPGGTLQLFSLANVFGGGALPAGTSDITISINGFGGPLGSAVYYSQAGFPDTLNTNGGAYIDPTPLPSTWTMLIAGFLGLGFFAYHGTKKSAAAPAAA